jgi:hypothetical protein
MTEVLVVRATVDKFFRTPPTVLPLTIRGGRGRGGSGVMYNEGAHLNG